MQMWIVQIDFRKVYYLQLPSVIGSVSCSVGLGLVLAHLGLGHDLVPVKVVFTTQHCE